MEFLQRNAAHKKTASVLERRKLWMWSNIPATYVPASHWCLASFLAALLCGGDRRRIPIYCHFPDQKMSPAEGKQHTSVTQGLAGRAKSRYFGSPAYWWGGKGKEAGVDGTGTFQKLNRRMRVFKKNPQLNWRTTVLKYCLLTGMSGLKLQQCASRTCRGAVLCPCLGCSTQGIRNYLQYSVAI